MTKKRTILKTKDYFNEPITLIKTKKGYTITRWYYKSKAVAVIKHRTSLYEALKEVLRQEQNYVDFIDLLDNHLIKLKGKKESEILHILRKSS